MFSQEVYDANEDCLEHGAAILTATIQSDVHGEVVYDNHQRHQAVITVMP